MILPQRSKPVLVILNPKIEIVAPIRRLVLVLVQSRRIGINDMHRLVYRRAVIVVNIRT
jgi:hypothetical protein